MEDMIKLVSEVIQYATVGAGIFILWYIVKHSVVKLRDSIDLLNERYLKGFDKICEKIDKHEETTSRTAIYLRKEHDEMIRNLGRINGYKTEGGS